MASREFSVVVAASMPDFGIGFENKLPWRIGAEMKYFKSLTSATDDATKKNAVIMGRKTWESIPQKFKPLSNRINVVLTRSPNSETAKAIAAENDTMVASSLNEAVSKLSWPPYRDAIEKIFVIGGAQLYDEALKSENLGSVYLTKIYHSFECDTFLKMDSALFSEASLGERQRSNPEKDDCDVEYQFFEWAPKKPTESEPENDQKTDVVACDPKHEEYQYLNLIQKILDSGIQRGDRTGTGTLSVFGSMMRFDLRNDVFPLLTTKRVFWRGLAEELLWFIAGCTNANKLAEKRVHIWDGNGSREFLDNRGLKHYADGDLGPVYGFQWRHFGAKYRSMNDDYSGEGVDQLAQCIDTIKNNPNSRRIIMSAWNPADLDKMALPPCHMFCQFYVANGELSCQMYQRSADMGLGVPFNIASYALLTRIVAQVCGLKAGDFVHCIGDTHVYSNHVDPLREQLKREPRQFPLLKMNPNKTDVDDFLFSDFKIIGYKPHPTIKMKMAV